jgi:hypothetical protein
LGGGEAASKIGIGKSIDFKFQNMGGGVDDQLFYFKNIQTHAFTRKYYNSIS